MKKEGKENEPCYKKELEIYEKETADKLEVFRLARANWLANVDDSEDTFAKVKEGVQESNIYKGRFFLLRKIHLKATLLRIHYKSLRPLRYWTFKRKIPEIDVYEETVHIKKVKKLVKRSELKEPRSSDQLWTKAAIKEWEQVAAKIKGKRDRRQTDKECKKIRLSDPCTKAVERLKDSKRKQGLVESCKCKGGREVTVVIKGICLCDKGGLNNLDLSKVCDEYAKMVKGQHSEVSWNKATARSAETPRKKPADMASGDTEKKVREEPDIHEGEQIENWENTNKVDDEDETKELKVKDFVDVINNKSFLDKGFDMENDERIIREKFDPASKKKLKFENEKFLKGDGGKKVSTGSDITVYRKFSSDELFEDSGAELEAQHKSSPMEKKKKEKAAETQKLSPKWSDRLEAHVKNYVKTLTELDKSPKMPPEQSLNNLFTEEELRDPELKKSKGGTKKLPDKSSVNLVSAEIIHRDSENLESNKREKTKSLKKIATSNDHNRHVIVTTEIKRRDPPKIKIPNTNLAKSISEEIIHSEGLDMDDTEEFNKSPGERKTESMNNLLPNKEQSGSVKLKPNLQPEKQPPGESALKPGWKNLKLSNSTEIHKKKLEKKQELESKEADDVNENEDMKPNGRKVVLVDKHIVIPPAKNSGRTSAAGKPQPKSGATIYSATGKLESREAQTMLKSLNNNIDKETDSRKPESNSRSLYNIQSKSEIKSGQEVSSTITLYRNTSGVQSEMALTKEECEKMEEVANAQNGDQNI